MNLKELFNIYSSLNLKTDRYLLAFSGGGDSVFLLVTLAEFYKEDLNKHFHGKFIIEETRETTPSLESVGEK